MATAERLASSRGWNRISVIAGIGVRNYYRRLGYEQRGAGQYLIKEIEPCGPALEPKDLELPFLLVAREIKDIQPLYIRDRERRRRIALALTVGLAAVGVVGIALRRRWRNTSA